MYLPGHILVISCYELGHMPHGVALPMAFLQRAGFAPACVDLTVEPLPDDAVARAELVAISVPMHTALRLGVAVAARVRAKNPRARICFFGLYAALNAAYLRELGADWAFGGETEQRLVDIALALARGEQPAAPDAPVLARLSFPLPSRDALPALSRYARLDMGDGSERLVGYVETTRGCRDLCRHCPVPAVYGGRLFVIDADTVLADIAALVARGAEHITFGDPDFLNGPGHSLKIVRAMHARFPALSFDITAQIAHLSAHRDRLAELAELGCAFVVSAVESLSDRVLDKLRKRHRRGDVEHVLARCREVGLSLRPTFVTFTPWTTLADLCELIEFIDRWDLIDEIDPVQLSVRLLVPPGSLLLAGADSRDAFGALDPGALSHGWRHPDPRMDALQRDIAARVERGTGDGENPRSTFHAVRALIYRAAGEPIAPPRVRVPRQIARITEPWFC